MEDCQEKYILPVALDGQIMWSAKDASFEKRPNFSNSCPQVTLRELLVSS